MQFLGQSVVRVLVDLIYFLSDAEMSGQLARAKYFNFFYALEGMEGLNISKNFCSAAVHPNFMILFSSSWW